MTTPVPIIQYAFNDFLLLNEGTTDATHNGTASNSNDCFFVSNYGPNGTTCLGIRSTTTSGYISMGSSITLSGNS